MGLNIDADIETPINSRGIQSIMKMGKNDQNIGMIMTAQSNAAGNYECAIVLFTGFSKIMQ